jgi:nuclear receptor interaction protein
VSRFNTDDTRVLFETEKAAVLAFAQALRIPFADLTGAVVPTSDNRTLPCDVQDRTAARRRWAYQVGRGVLYNASKDVKFKFVDRAFGGRGIADSKIRAEEQALREEQEDIDSLDDEGPVTEAELVGGTRAQRSSTAATGTLSPSDSTDGTQFLDIEEDGEDSDDDEDDYDDEESDADAESFDEHDDDDDDDDEYDDEDGDGLRRTRSGRMLWRSDFGRSRFKKEKAELDVPCAPHTRIYTGHCNVKTVKDVNFFGLQDDYVVSGSDSGHVFIWDRKTTQLLNILEGDGEVVNVVQGMPLICLGLWRLLMNAGHPYEPTMAVSGIDHTIKIFSPDSRDQRNARKGIGVQSSDAGGFSTLNWGRRRRPEATEATDEDDPRPAEALSDSDEEVASNGLRSRKRMHEAYQITSKNDMDRKGGREDYFISVSRIFDAFAAPTDYLQQAVFAQLARHLATQQAGGGEGGEGPVVVTEENCSVM